jgi:hypothetical protein
VFGKSVWIGSWWWRYHNPFQMPIESKAPAKVIAVVEICSSR